MKNNDDGNNNNNNNNNINNRRPIECLCSQVIDMWSNACFHFLT